MSPVLILIAVAAGPGMPADVAAPGPVPSTVAIDEDCRSQDPRQIIVCAQRRQGYRLDPSTMDAAQEAKERRGSATMPKPLAQAACSAQPQGCGRGLEGIDLTNVAVVLGTMGVRALQGKDWARPLRPGYVDEYQLYLQAKHRREAQAAQKRAQAAAANARRAQ